MPFTMSGQLTFSMRIRNTVWILVWLVACALRTPSKTSPKAKASRNNEWPSRHVVLLGGHMECRNSIQPATLTHGAFSASEWLGEHFCPAGSWAGHTA